MDFGRIWAEVNLDALRQNLDQIRKVVGDRRIMVAVKADGYGHGLREIAVELAPHVDSFGVAGVEEGISLRSAGIRNPILVLSPAPYAEIPALFEHGLTPTVTETGFAEQLSREARRRSAVICVHIEIDTGMGRTGVSVADALSFVPAVATMDGLEVEGVFTHFPAADTDVPFAESQVAEFTAFVDRLADSGIIDIQRHAANSAGMLNLPGSHLDMVRPGLLLYGILPDSYASARRTTDLDLVPVMSLRTRVVNLRRFPPGQSISYERNYFTKRDSRIAVVTAGYGDGYPYSLTNRGHALVRGVEVPIVGNVCMDLTMLDVTDVPGADVGDVATLLGTDGNVSITANDVAGWAGTIPYEIICRVSPRVPRVYLRGGQVAEVKNLLSVADNRY